MRLALLLTGLALLLFTNCDDDCISGMGPIVSEEFDLDPIDGVRLFGSFDLEVNQSTEQSVVVHGNQNIIDRLNRTVTGGVWNIDLQSGCYDNFNLEVIVNIPDVQLVELEGSGNVTLGNFDDLVELWILQTGSGAVKQQGGLQLSDLIFVQMEGSGDVELAIVTPNVVTSMVGSGNMIVTGTATNENISISGSGNYQGFNLLSDTTNVSTTGSGNAEVRVDSLLNVVIVGSGDVHYRGNPIIQSQISGSGKLIDAN